MNLDELKPAWNELERRVIAQQTVIDELLLKQTSRDVQKSIKPLMFGQIAQIVIGVALAGLGAQFWIPRTGISLFLVSGLITHLYGVALIINGIRVLRKVLAVDFSSPVLVVQKGIAEIESTYVTSGWVLGLPWWLLWIPISIVVLTFAGIDLLRVEPSTWLIPNIVIGVLGMVATVFGYRYLRSTANPEIQSRLDRMVAGASIQEAKARLADFEQFERE